MARPRKPVNQRAVCRTVSIKAENNQWIETLRDEAEKVSGFRPGLSDVINKLIEAEKEKGGVR